MKNKPNYDFDGVKYFNEAPIGDDLRKIRTPNGLSLTRDVETALGTIRDIATLQTYLFADPNNFVTYYDDRANVYDIRSDGSILRWFDHVTGVEVEDVPDVTTIDQYDEIIACLRNLAPVEDDRLDSRWDEIRAYVAVLEILN